MAHNAIEHRRFKPFGFDDRLANSSDIISDFIVEAVYQRGSQITTRLKVSGERPRLLRFLLACRRQRGRRPLQVTVTIQPPQSKAFAFTSIPHHGLLPQIQRFFLLSLGGCDD
jgi:hypothetical protein